MTGRRRPRGGKGGAEPRARIRLREVRALELTLAGQTQHAIATALGISQPAVCKILRRLEDRLLGDLAWRVERHRARQTLRLEFLYAEAMRAWHDSQQDRLRKRQRKSGAGAGQDVTLAELVSENRHGDPRYLDEARKALADLRRVWGVDAPERLRVTALPFEDLSDEALDEELARQRRLLAAAAATAPPPPTDPA